MRFRLVLIGLVIVLLSCGWWYLDHVHDPMSVTFSNAERNKLLELLLGRKANLTPNIINSQWKEYSGSSITFAYPYSARVYPPESPIPREPLDQLHFSIGEPRTYMTIQVIPFADLTSLNEYPSVSYRLANPTTYRVHHTTLRGYSGIGFTTQQSEQGEFSSFYFIHGKVYLFDATGVDFHAVETLYIQILASVQIL